ncbi:2,3-dihydro-2,3-dihydroxybenzoate dehydrogenase [Streptomyces sp. NPDC047928]|uniref:2,3-dihydro-2,3-dihydroxybenzoate dehydrogenase n=1 Tax=unclassified Streptomyces TaxID=2593676 RepID=UPI00371C3242
MRAAGYENAVVLVTGAGQGIGASVARAFAGRGARVAALDANAEAVEKVVAEIEADGGRAGAYPADVRDAGAVEDVVERVETDHGPIDVLANVAGILRTGPVVGITDEDWATVLAVNTTGVFHVSRAVARRMLPRRSGAIVTVASNAAGVPRMHMAAYAASKAATVMFTKCLGLELAGSGIRCNLVSPGSTDTPMQRAMWKDGSSSPQAAIDGSLDTYRAGIPLRKLAEPSDVADAVLFLASDAAGHITMQDLYVDGGAALRA